MRIRGVIIFTLALLFAIVGLSLHLAAMFSTRWTVTIPLHIRGPNDQTRYYGLWTRCQYSNTSFVTPDVTSQPNIENLICRPNTYLRYKADNEEISRRCYHSRHLCSSISGVHQNCQCEYLPVTQIQQGCAILVAIFLLLAIFFLYLNLIASPQNASATFILTFAPMALLSLALLLMIATMILVGAFLRRNQYEDYDVRLPKQIFGRLPMAPDTFNLYRLHAFLKRQNDTQMHQKMISMFRSIHKDRFRARIDWSAGAEIAAITVTFFTYMLSLIPALAQVN